MKTSSQMVQKISLKDSAFPQRLRQIEDPPHQLYVWGDPSGLSKPSLSVVGAREARVESLQWVRNYLRPVIEKGYCLVSGGARGVDREVHRTCLLKGKPTVVVVPSGLDQLYPQELEDWAESIVSSGGCLVSEYEPDVTMKRHHFLRRNRIVSGLSSVTLVVEAARKSGSWMTGRLARDQGRTVAVLPGFPADVHRQGTVDLLVDGAQAIRDDLDLLALLAIAYPDQL